MASKSSRLPTVEVRHDAFAAAQRGDARGLPPIGAYAHWTKTATLSAPERKACLTGMKPAEEKIRIVIEGLGRGEAPSRPPAP